MKLALAICLLVTMAAPPQGTRPTGGGSPLYGAFLGRDLDGRFEGAIGYFARDVQQAVRTRLAKRSSYRSRIAFPARLDFPADIMWQRRRDTELGLLALSDRSGAETDAADFAKSAPLAYEWEGYPDGPVGEARYAATYLRQHPQTRLAAAIDLFLLYEYRCAFEAAGRTVKEYKEARQKDAMRAIQRTAAADYITVWQRVQKNSDVVIRAVAEDIDEQQFLYTGGEGHPRTFRVR